MTVQREASLGTESQGTRSVGRGSRRAGPGVGSGAQRKAVTSPEPGWAWGQGALPLGVACLGVPGPGGVRRGTVLTVGRERSACCRAHLGLGLRLWGTWPGGPGRRDSCCR